MLSMRPFFRFSGFGFLAASLAGAVGTAAPHQTPENSVNLLSLNQPPCTVPTAKSVIKLKFAYQIAESEAAPDGYAVSVKFQSTDPRMTFSVGSQGQTAVTSKRDTVTLEYPMASILRAPRLQHPITCYVYLHRNMGQGRSRVIAKTPAIVFQECQ
jgi:hypothetical protein